MEVPFVDLYAQYLSIKEEIDNAIENTIRESAYIGGSTVKNFETNFSNYLGITNVVSCANGTDSLEIILEAQGIGRGDEVIVPALSWISTSEAVSSVGATPVFVDIHPDYYTINVDLIKEKITANTRAIIPVHLYGNPADMEAIVKIAKEFNLFVLEDCAQAHGAMLNGKMVGTFGDASSFSFYPGKNLGAYGDAGAIATNNQVLADKCRMIANHGQIKKHHHKIEGRNSRLDGLQAAILDVKLKHLSKWTMQRQKNASVYRELLKDKSSITLPTEQPKSEHVYHLFVIKTNRREELTTIFSENKIGWAIHYPEALPFLDAYLTYGYKQDDFPVAYQTVREIISLPMYSELSEEEIEFVSSLL
jgi:dTDP-4-amino-4,6-dideoxygalactose transaminase